MATQNPFLLAADNNPALLPLLRENPTLASSQDEHGYSLVHAAASYNHLDLLRTLVREFGVDVDLKDEDDETALFVVETQDAAKVLVEELGANINHRGSEGLTAKEKIEAEQEFPDVAQYLLTVETKQMDDPATTAAAVMPEVIPPPPEGMKVTVGTMDETADIPEEIDPEFRRRIEELAQRDDFNTPQGQTELRRLVEDAILGEGGVGDERNVRSKQD
ncbi:ankyrin repeat-containing protein [Fusarium heterosporum]|uniref:Ankyrin repeat-containing protein n=1 Tax=Fusarium heterosporum TaxID=42747 RepID=A0A8H5TSC7_FUSHE|nr:ankyrin repeat-containing protein [Fusarium heterosporum]